MEVFERMLLKDFPVISSISGNIIGAVSQYRVGNTYQLMFHRLTKNQSYDFEKIIFGIPMTDEEGLIVMPSSLDEVDILLERYLSYHGIKEPCFIQWY